MEQFYQISKVTKNLNKINGVKYHLQQRTSADEK